MLTANYILLVCGLILYELHSIDIFIQSDVEYQIIAWRRKKKFEPWKMYRTKQKQKTFVWERDEGWEGPTYEKTISREQIWAGT